MEIIKELSKSEKTSLSLRLPEKLNKFLKLEAVKRNKFKDEFIEELILKGLENLDKP